MSSTPRKPTFIPLLIGIIACLLSLIVLILFKQGNPFIYFAYVCTPFVPIGGLALARAIDIKGRSSIHFDIAKSEKIVKSCGILAIVGFVIAFAVMYEIAMRFSSI